MPPLPQPPTLEEILEMIRTIGGTAEVYSTENAAMLALRLQVLEDFLTTYILVIGIVPNTPLPRQWTDNAVLPTVRFSRRI